MEFYEDSDSSNRIRNAGGQSGRRLGIIKGRAGRMPNALLKRLANDPKVKRIHIDRETEGQIARTVATIGAKNVHAQYGYTGAGIGVAVIDSGITPWHDDLTVANRQGQRVTAFVDFVNRQTQKYDDWGHGTHVAGIIAGNGYDSAGARIAVAPGANIISLKALDDQGRGRISQIIAALDWAVTNKALYNIRVINMSLGAGVFESYNTDPLTVAAKRAVDAGIVVVAAAGNLGKTITGAPQYGAITAPGNAPWVLTVGASSTMGTIDRRDDTIALYSSRGPTMIDHAAKPDLVAPGTGTVSLSTQGSLFYSTKAAFLVEGRRSDLRYLPYLTLSGTSMAAPVVAGSVALMLEANPKLTPNMVKAILQYTAQVYKGYNYLTQGAGFLNTLGAVRLSRYFATGHRGEGYPNMKGWSKHIFWGNRRVSGGVLTPGGTAWALNIVWGEALTPLGKHIVWGENCTEANCDNIAWGSNAVWGQSDSADRTVWGATDADSTVWGATAADSIVWGATDADNIVWGNGVIDNIVWGNGVIDNIVWGNVLPDNIVWGNDCGGADCTNIVWGFFDLRENIVWGNAEGLENIVWGNTTLLENIVWGNSGLDDTSWGNSAGDGETYGDDTAELETFDPSVWEDLFEVPSLTTTAQATTTATTTKRRRSSRHFSTSYVLGGGVQ